MNALIKRYLGKISLIVGSIGASLVIAEVVLRLFSAGYLDHPTNGHPVLHHVQPPDFEFASFDMAAEFGGHSVIYNEDGFRVPYHGYRFDGTLKDVVFLGDSFVEASEVPYEQTFVALFAKDFKDFNTRNFGVSSYSPLISYLQLEYFMESIDPVLVVQLIFENDLDNDERYYGLAEWDDGRIVAVPGDPPDLLHKLLRRSYVARLINRAQLTIQAIMNMPANAGDADTSLYLEDPDLGEITPTYIKKNAQLASENGFRYILMCVPSKIKFNYMRAHKDICEKIKRLAVENEIEYVDLDSFFSENAGNSKPFFNRNIHFNETGHRLTYLALKEYLNSNPLRGH